MRILVVCGAGASSTFVAHRVRQAASARGLDYTAHAGTEASLPVDLDSADVVLVGPHLAASLDDIARMSAASGAVAVLLPPDVFADRSGERTIDLLQNVLATRAHADMNP
jgi:cellobiose PTS system EIIB component